MRDIRKIVAEVDALAPADSSKLDLDRLHALSVEYFSHPQAAEYQDRWFRLYERFPDIDSHGVFWSILHGIEAQPGSDTHVVASVLRKPTEFPVLMVNRILNSGQFKVGDVDLLCLLQSVVEDVSASPEVRLDAKSFLEYQSNDSE